MKIYTKKGDRGQTSLFSGKKVPKNHPIIEAIGCVDECNSAIGMALSLLPKFLEFKDLEEQLLGIQHTLFELGAILASSPTKTSLLSTKELEQWIDWMEEKLPPLQHFILPNGHSASSTLQLARAVCRRAERALVTDIESKDAPPESLVYLNRLSDYLFVAARLVNFHTQTPEIIWLSKPND
ncbi:Cob(I)yrinic acid a,c-diamide adenosyltransferase [Parachlamydia sp. AcF125]|nr:Cob(I)yrinic acid a,c-diamide adenosyltransferase [Parachlamydia sp. AcF125]